MSIVLQPTLRMGGRVFWAYLWRVLLISVVLGVVVGVLGAVLHFVAPALAPVLEIIMWVASFVISIIVFSIVFDKRYKHYSVRLVDNTTGEVMPRHWKHGLRPWWSYMWRCMVLAAVFLIPTFIFGAGAFGEEFKLAKLQAECKQFAAIYQQAQAKNDAAVMQSTAQAFEARQCTAAFAPPSPEKIAERKARGLGLLIGLILGTIIGIAAQFKIFQIVLRKRYERFHVQVTANEGAAA